MVFDKVTVLIEHQDNGKFSVFYCKAGANEWFGFVTDLNFQDAKDLVKLIKVAFQLQPDLSRMDLYDRISEMRGYIYNVGLVESKLTASKLFNIFSANKV